MILGMLAAFSVVGCLCSSSFDELFQPSWALDHFTYEGEVLKMKLDNYSGKYTTNQRTLFLFQIFLFVVISYIIIASSLCFSLLFSVVPHAFCVHECKFGF